MKKPPTETAIAAMYFVSRPPPPVWAFEPGNYNGGEIFAEDGLVEADGEARVRSLLATSIQSNQDCDVLEACVQIQSRLE